MARRNPVSSPFLREAGMRRISFVVVFAGVLLLPLIGCSPNAPPPVAELPPVQVSRPVEQEVTDFYEFQGRTTALYSVDVRAQVTGS